MVWGSAQLSPPPVLRASVSPLGAAWGGGGGTRYTRTQAPSPFSVGCDRSRRPRAELVGNWAAKGGRGAAPEWGGGGGSVGSPAPLPFPASKKNPSRPSRPRSQPPGSAAVPPPRLGASPPPPWEAGGERRSLRARGELAVRSGGPLAVLAPLLRPPWRSPGTERAGGGGGGGGSKEPRGTRSRVGPPGRSVASRWGAGTKGTSGVGGGRDGVRGWTPPPRPSAPLPPAWGGRGGAGCGGRGLIPRCCETPPPLPGYAGDVFPVGVGPGAGDAAAGQGGPCPVCSQWDWF